MGSDFISEGAEQQTSKPTRALLRMLARLLQQPANSQLFLSNNCVYISRFQNNCMPDECSGMQEFITTSEPTDLTAVRVFLEYNNFRNNRNNDYINNELGLILEDLHDENVLSANGILFFIDTIFYLTPNFYDA